MSLALILNLCFFLSLCMYIYMYHIKRLFSFAVSQIGHRRVYALPLERDRGMIPMMTRVGVGDTFEVCWDTIVHFLLLLTVVSLWNRIVASISMIFLQKKKGSRTKSVWPLYVGATLCLSVPLHVTGRWSAHQTTTTTTINNHQVQRNNNNNNQPSHFYRTTFDTR